MNLKELVAKKYELIALKKAEIKTVKGGLSALVQGSVSKGLYENSDTSLKRTIIGNTYNWMDSHDDVHAKGVFTKSIKERANQIFHLHDHEFKLTAKVGEPLKIYEDEVKWADLGVQKEGTTQALFLDSEILRDYNERIFNEYKNNKINQHSVGMQYVKIDLAVNDEDEEEEYKVWQDNIDSIGNKEVAESKGYFWLVREAKLIEISAVLMGSNSLTPTINEPSVDTQKQEPSNNDTQKTELFFKTLLNKN
jgi:hypothetical protein